MRKEIILGGRGGQGLIMAGAILAEAAGVIEGKEVVQLESYGNQMRGGASQSMVIISEERIRYPEVFNADIVLCLSQEAYECSLPRLQEGGLLIVDKDLVDVGNVRPDVHVKAFPFTAEAEKLNCRIAANVIALGALAKATGLVRAESLAEALPMRLSERNAPVALRALEAGVRLAEKKIEVWSG